MEEQTLDMRLRRGGLDRALESLYGKAGLEAARSRCAGVLEDSVVVIYAPDEITAGRLDNERIRTVLLEEAQEALGKTVISRLIFRVGNPPIGSPEENFKALLKNFGGQYDNVEFT